VTSRDIFMAGSGIFITSMFWVMMLHLGPLLIRWISRKKRAKEALGSVNVLGPLVLPMPNDVRWEGDVRRRRLGVVEVQDGVRLYIDGQQLPVSRESIRYCRAVNASRRRENLQRMIKKVDQTVQEYSPIEKTVKHDDPYGDDMNDMLVPRKA